MTAMKTPWTLLLVVIAATGAGLAWRANLHLRTTKTASADAAVARSRIAAENERMLKLIEEAKVGRAELDAELTRLNATAIASRTSTHTIAAIASSPTRHEPTPREDASRVARFRGGLAPRYSQFYREMGFTSEQVTNFENLLTVQESRLVDFLAATRSSAVTLSPAERDALREKEKARVEVERRQLLGDAGYERLQEYESSGRHRRIVRELVSGLALTATPLSVEQGGQLMRLLAELSFEDSGGADRESWAPVLERAQDFLTPEQLMELDVLARKSHGLAALNGLARLVREAKP